VIVQNGAAAASAALGAASRAALDLAQREAILRTKGLGAAMRLIELRAGGAAAAEGDAGNPMSGQPADLPAWVAECWRWVSWLQASRGLAVATMTAYVSTLGAFVAWCEKHGLDYAAVPLDSIDEWQRDLWYHRRNSAGRRAYALSALKSFYDWRHTRGFGPNCTSGARLPKTPKRMPRKYTKQQLQQLFIAARKGKPPLVAMRDEVLLIVLYATGMRREEIANLRPDQIDMDDRIAVIRVEGKGAKEREVAIEGPAVTILRNWLAKRAELGDVMAETVFFTVRRNWYGRQMQAKTVERAVCSIANRAGLGEWGVHRFRVTFATRLYDDGTDLERIRILLGHETIETTRRYIAVSGKQRKFRLKAFRQHEVLGTRPAGMPLWAEKVTGERLETGG